MPRRKKNNSAFEFTGDEAEAAEQAFRLRHAHHTRKPKISVTSISPLSAISKLLHSRSPTTSTPSQPSKRRTHSKPSKKPASSASPAQTPGDSAGRAGKPDRTVETPTPSPSLQTPSPSRRSRRRKIPSFKLRGSVKQAVGAGGDTSHTPPVETETLPEEGSNPPEANDDDLRNQPLGKGHVEGLKRPRVVGDPDEGDARDMTVVPRVKRRRSHEEADDTECPPETTVKGNGSGECPEQRDDIEKDRTPSSAAKHSNVSKSETHQKRIQRDTVEIHKQDMTDVENADNDGKETEDSGARERKETLDSDPAEKVVLSQNEPDTTEKEVAERSSEPKAPPPSVVENAVEPPESDEKDIFDDCDPILSEERFQSPVTPQKADSEGDLAVGPSQDEQSNDAVLDDGQEPKQSAAKTDETDARDTAVRDSSPTAAGNKKTNAKDVKFPANASEKDSEKEVQDAQAKSSESKAEKVTDPVKNDEKANATEEPNTTLKSEEKQQPLEEQPVKEQPVKEQPAKEQPAKEQPTKEQPAKEQPTKEQPAKEQPAKEQPAKEQPTKEQPTKEQPTKEQPTKEQPTKEQPAKQEPAKEQPTKQEPTKQEPVNQEPESTAKGSAQESGDEKETATRGKETENSAKRSSITQKLQNVVEHLSPGKRQSGVTKRVRFSEPSRPYRASERKLGFSGIVKMRRRRARRHRTPDTDPADVSVAGAGTDDSNKKDRHLLLDELQYLLDGIFSKFTNGNKKGQTPDNDVVASSLQALIRLLLKRPAKSSPESEENQDEDSAVIVQILAEQPDLLKKIVIRFCSALGKSKTSDALLALVFVLIFRATPKLTLISEHELDLLLNAFFRSSGSSLKNNERDGQKPVEERKQTEKGPPAKRRGKLGRMLEQKKQKDDSLPQLLELMSASDIMEAGCTVFKTEADAAAHLMGTAISLLLRNEAESRVWMRQNRRLDRVVAILYSCEKIRLSQPANENDADRENSTAMETGASWIVMEASLRVLEFAVLDPVCQQRLARESRVGSIIVDLLRTIKSIKTGPLESEWMICAALRLCINLCHGCEEASRQLVDSKGHEVVLSCLVKECLAAGLLQKNSTLPVPEDVEESFDVRVLCLAVLASTVNQEETVCNSFHEMHAESIQDPERSAISLILEVLRTAELESKKEEGKQNGDEAESGTIRRTKTTKEEEAERDRRAQFIMERKITIGYVCLLVGALSCDSKANRERIQGRLPGQTFLGIAAVLAEFLEFHHEVGVISGSMNRMYAEIIKKIVEPEAGKDDPANAAEELDEEEDKMEVDEELDEPESDLIDLLEDEEGKDEVTENTEREGPAESAACEKTAAVTLGGEST